MRILITGNMGYVGPVLVAHLRRVYPSATLIGYDNGYFAHCLTTGLRLPETLLHAQYFGDTRDVPAALLDGVDACIHLAAISNDPMGNRYEIPTDQINYRASVALAEKARDAGVKVFAFASSCSVYGFAEGGPRRESDPLNPLTAYARSKIGTEVALSEMELGDMRVVCLRFATACGMSPRLRLDLVLNDFVAGAMSSGHISVLSDGSPWRPLIDVADMARAFEWAISSDTGQRFLAVNCGSQEWNYQVRDLAEAVAQAVPNTRVSINENAPPDQRSYRVDFSLFRSIAPNHQPQVALKQSIDALVRGLTAVNFQDPDFRNSRLMRLKVLDELLAKNLVSQDLRMTHADLRPEV